MFDIRSFEPVITQLSGGCAGLAVAATTRRGEDWRDRADGNDRAVRVIAGEPVREPHAVLGVALSSSTYARKQPSGAR